MVQPFPTSLCVTNAWKNFYFTIALTHACIIRWFESQNTTIAANSLSLSNPLPLVGTISAIYREEFA